MRKGNGEFDRRRKANKAEQMVNWAGEGKQMQNLPDKGRRGGGIICRSVTEATKGERSEGGTFLKESERKTNERVPCGCMTVRERRAREQKSRSTLHNIESMGYVAWHGN